MKCFTLRPCSATRDSHCTSFTLFVHTFQVVLLAKKHNLRLPLFFACAQVIEGEKDGTYEEELIVYSVYTPLYTLLTPFYTFIAIFHLCTYKYKHRIYLPNTPLNTPYSHSFTHLKYTTA